MLSLFRFTAKPIKTAALAVMLAGLMSFIGLWVQPERALAARRVYAGAAEIQDQFSAAYGYMICFYPSPDLQPFVFGTIRLSTDLHRALGIGGFLTFEPISGTPETVQLGSGFNAWVTKREGNFMGWAQAEDRVLGKVKSVTLSKAQFTYTNLDGAIRRSKIVGKIQGGDTNLITEVEVSCVSNRRMDELLRDIYATEPDEELRQALLAGINLARSEARLDLIKRSLTIGAVVVTVLVSILIALRKRLKDWVKNKYKGAIFMK